MNRLAFAAALLVPSIASAHPGHSHAGMSSNHHLILTGAICAVVALGGFLLNRHRQLRADKARADHNS